MTQSPDKAPDLDDLRARWRAVARYTIYRHGMGSDNYSRVKTFLPEHTGLTWDEVSGICARMNKDARDAAGNPSDSWGLTQYYPSLETPTPEQWKAMNAAPRLA